MSASPHNTPVQIPAPPSARLAILESVFASITDSLLVMDGHLRIVDANTSLLARLGRTREDVIGADWASLFPHLAETGREKDLCGVLEQGQAHRGRMPLLHAGTGRSLLFDVTTYPLRAAPNGPVTHLVEYAHEVSEEVKLQLEIVDAHNDLLAVKEELEEKTAEIDAANHLLEEKCATLEVVNERLERLAVLDVMTDLPNHRAFQEWLARQVAQTNRHKRPFSLVMFDVDNFKQYNDRFGHPEGDLLLAQLAALMRQGIRATDLPARYGGEEFALILPETDKYGAALLAERLRAAVAAFEFPHRSVTISIGIAEYPCDAHDGSTLVTCADKAMYHAKSSGKNAVSLWSGHGGRPTLAATDGGEYRSLSQAALSPADFRSVPSLPPHLATGSASGRSLLLVDPDELSGDTMRESLLAGGYAVAVAQSGREALSLLSEARAAFDLIVSDVALPDKSGFDLQAEARVLCPQVPFLFLTAQTAAEPAARAARETEMPLLVKPFALYELSAQIDRALTSSRQRAQALAA